MNYIIFYNTELDLGQFINTAIKLNSLQSYVRLDSVEIAEFVDYKRYSDLTLNWVKKDIVDEEGQRTEKLYLTREKSHYDPKAYEIFLQDFEGQPIEAFQASLLYGNFRQQDGNRILDGSWLTAIISGYAIVLRDGGAIDDEQRMELDVLLNDRFIPFLNGGDWRSATEYWKLGIESQGIPPLKDMIPPEIAPYFVPLEMELDQYLFKYYNGLIIT